MASPDEHLLLVDRDGKSIAIDELVQKLRGDQSRMLADDQVGLVIYVGDMDIYELVPIETGGFLARHVTQISRPRFPVQILRKQIGARVFSVTADAVRAGPGNLHRTISGVSA